MKRWSQPLCDVFDKKDILYLSPYSSTGTCVCGVDGWTWEKKSFCFAALDQVDCSKVYVLGGVVDCNHTTKARCNNGQDSPTLASSPIHKEAHGLG